MDIQRLLNRAPKLPDFEANYQAFQLETIQGSGERFTVLIAACSATEFRVIQTISNKVIECMFGESAANFQGFIDLLQEDLEHHLSANKSLSDWIAPISGVTKSQLHTTRSATGMEGVLFQAITSYASLNQGEIVTKAMNELLDLEQDEDRPTVQLVKNVKSLIEQRAKHLANNFRKQITLSNGSEISMDYVGAHYNAGFSNFDVKQPKQAMNLAKAKLYDLQSLKADANRMAVKQEFELLAYLPNSSSKQTQKLLGELENSADEKSLRVRHFQSFSEMANTIIESEQKYG